MNKRDLAWRAAGLFLIALGCIPGNVAPPDGSELWPALTVLGILSAVAGIVLTINGRRVAMALRIERSRHRQLPLLIHARRTDRARRH